MFSSFSHCGLIYIKKSETNFFSRLSRGFFSSLPTYFRSSLPVSVLGQQEETSAESSNKPTEYTFNIRLVLETLKNKSRNCNIHIPYIECGNLCLGTALFHAFWLYWNIVPALLYTSLKDKPDLILPVHLSSSESIRKINKGNQVYLRFQIDPLFRKYTNSKMLRSLSENKPLSICRIQLS